MRQARSITATNQTIQLDNISKSIPSSNNINIKSRSQASEDKNNNMTYHRNIQSTRSFEILNNNLQTITVSNTKKSGKIKAGTTEGNYRNYNKAIKNITKSDKIFNEAKTSKSYNNIRYDSSTNMFNSKRRRITRQLNNTKQTKIVSVNRITTLFNSINNITNFAEKYGRTIEKGYNTLPSTKEYSKLPTNLSPQLESNLINTGLIEDQNLTKVHNQDNQSNLEVTSTNKPIVNNNKRAKTTN